jgi:hypothetical protein
MLTFLTGLMFFGLTVWGVVAGIAGILMAYAGGDTDDLGLTVLGFLVNYIGLGLLYCSYLVFTTEACWQ